MPCLPAMILIAATAAGGDLPADSTLSPPPGAFVETGVRPVFRSESPLITRPYVCWYDAPKLEPSTLGLARQVATASPGRSEGEWSRFRGSNGSGISDATTVPVRWTEKDYNWKV